MALSLDQGAVQLVEDRLPAGQQGLTAAALRQRLDGYCAQNSVRAILRFLVKQRRAITDDSTGKRVYRRAAP